ncbi:kinase-like protein [Didymella exigua CBS 183.55]|uniref:Kinase-like protein n=1 Tax=Didymella exigua CBS 183.55 TaxID=1150837 RepID=A0A6A5S2B3_9PLEO|nr:kinase-like protein [Didymella exigua CBS 183.55]KAF1933448.1 kinase-like protein [Didymella exigua CBS 183.55]
MADEIMAFFDIRLAGCDPFNTHGTIEVCGNEQFMLGRDSNCRYSWHDDFTISREHLRVHCILYEQDPIADIAPFVYATDVSANGTYLKKSNAECNGSQGRGVLMGKNGTFLLDDGDELQLSETVTLIYHSFGTVKHCVLTSMQEREKLSLASRYLITGRLLGEGGYGKVLIGIDQKSQRQLACKIVNLEKLYDRRVILRGPTSNGQWTSSQAISQLPEKIQSCFREFDILKDLSHPNIVHIQKVFWSRRTIYMFQELVTGGDLFSYIEYKQGKIPSIESAVIIRQVLKGVEYLHGQDIVHRDLKPDNILMTSLDSGARVIITDFGNARFLPNANTQHDLTDSKLRRMFSIVGTLEYTAPEIHRANEAIPRAWGYSLSVDMWSIGSITAAILTGEQIFSCRQNGPFEEDARRVIVQLAAQCDLSVLDDEYHPLWGSIASAPKDFIKRLLVLDEEDRMSATEALSHIWFTHPMMAAEFEAQYERSIRKWRPRRKDDQLIEQISTSKPTPKPVQSFESAPADETASCFFKHKHAPFQESPVNDLEYAHEPQTNDQFASQPMPYSHDNTCAEVNPQEFYQNDEYTQLEGNYDAAPHWASDDQQTNAKPIGSGPPAPQSRRYKVPTEATPGQLQRVGTTTRGRYFQREIVDLDDLDGPVHSVRDDGVHPRAIRREETVQVRTTPSADSEAYDGVDRWWHHRYPQTQYHYDTQAEPNTQEEDQVLAQETPPELFLKPQKDLFAHASKKSQGCRQVYEEPFAYKVSKPRKVYGRHH